MKDITSADNALFKRLLKLNHSARERRTSGCSLLDGVHLVAAYREHCGAPEEIIVSRSGLADREIAALLAKLAQPPAIVSNGLFRQLSTVATPTGIIAVVRTPRPEGSPDLETPSVLLEDIQDPGNVGSVLRSAAAAGIRQVVLSRSSVHAWSPRVLRAGMGAHFGLAIYEGVDLPACVAQFRGTVIATARKAAQSVFDTDLTRCVALLFGNEGAGLSADALAAAHEVVSIPMPGEGESLNVAAAAAVCLFERVRQRQQRGPRIEDRG